LCLVGSHSHGDHGYFLPDEMSAQELGDHLAVRAGLIAKPTGPTDKLIPDATGPNEPLRWKPNQSFADWKRESEIPFYERMASKEEYRFSQPFTADEPQKVKSEYRRRLSSAIHNIEPVRPRASIIKSV